MPKPTFKYTAVCTDQDSGGTYKHIVRRFASSASNCASFTRRKNYLSRSTPASNKDWENGQ